MIVRLPAALSQDGKPGMIDLEITGPTTLGSVLGEIEKKLPGTTRKILTGDGGVHRYVNLYVNGDDVRHAAGLGTLVGEGDEVLVLPAISGG